jgi:hypothetical protein
MPCPEQQAWGGVLKTTMLRLYGTRQNHPFLHRIGTALLPVFVAWTRWRYRALARRIAREIADYCSSGFVVLGVVGVDGSPSCGLSRTIDVRGAASAISALDPRTVSTDQLNGLLRGHLRQGSGLFMVELRKELRRRRLEVRLCAHDLFDESEGRRSGVELEPAGAQ